MRRPVTISHFHPSLMFVGALRLAFSKTNIFLKKSEGLLLSVTFTLALCLWEPSDWSSVKQTLLEKNMVVRYYQSLPPYSYVCGSP
jgi:hypothetical protein